MDGRSGLPVVWVAIVQGRTLNGPRRENMKRRFLGKVRTFMVRFTVQRLSITTLKDELERRGYAVIWRREME